MTRPSPSELSRFGIAPADEELHPVAPDEPFWNESVFFDWVRDERLAGHCRIGRMPGQGRAWVWLHLLHEGEWLVLEEPHLPDASFDGFDYDAPGLRIRREVVEPLAQLRLLVRGTARVVSGRRAGRLLPVEVSLDIAAAGPAHSLGEQGMAGHSTEGYSANRYEQPVRVRGVQRVGEDAVSFEGRGERDHSWGPRYWNMEWAFVALHGESLRLQCARVTFDEDAWVEVGYLDRGEMRHVVTVELELAYHDDDLARPYEGRVRVVDEAGDEVTGRLEPLGATEIDASHCFDPPQPSLYRRALVRFVPDDGSGPVLGFLEVNRFPKGLVLGGTLDDA